MGSVERAQEFSAQLAREIRRFKEEDIPDVVRKSAFDALDALIQLTPVDTGYARGNWIVSLDTPSSEVGPESQTDKVGQRTYYAQLEKLNVADAFPHVFLTNNTPYIEVLDDGRIEGGYRAEESVFGEITSPVRRRASGSRQNPIGILQQAFDEVLEELDDIEVVED